MKRFGVNAPTVDPDRNAVARHRVRLAMQDIERAQRLLGAAAEQLSAVRYGNPDQRRVMALYDRVHSQWYRCQTLLGDRRIELDRDPTAAEVAEVDARDVNVSRALGKGGAP